MIVHAVEQEAQDVQGASDTETILEGDFGPLFRKNIQPVGMPIQNKTTIL